MILAWATALSTITLAQSAGEEVARRQLESGRAFAKQGNYTEALKDFRAVADTHPNSSVADNALLEIARYYIDVAGDTKEAAAAVDAIVKKYATSDSAPDAYLLAGRLALARSHQSADLDSALANFERVFRLFPSSGAVPRSLTLVGETMWYARRYDDARANLSRTIAEFPTDATAAEAYLTLGKVLLALGEPVLAMEEMQQVRNRWPNTPAAATALARTSTLHRLYIRAKGGPAWALSADTIGPVKLQNVVGLAWSGKDALFSAAETGLSVLTSGATERPQAVVRPRGITVDLAGQVVAFDAGALRPPTGAPLTLAVPQSGGTPKALSNLQAATQVSNGDWLVADSNDRVLQRFSSTGTHVGTFGAGRITRLASTETDLVAGLDKDAKSVVVFDGAGTLTARIPLKTPGYDLEEAEDLTFDAFGHLYVLSRTSIAVFSPYPAAPVATATAAPAAAPASAGAPAAARAGAYRLLTVFAPPQNDPAGFRRATSFVVDPSGTIYLYDDRAERVMVYR